LPNATLPAVVGAAAAADDDDDDDEDEDEDVDGDAAAAADADAVGSSFLPPPIPVIIASTVDAIAGSAISAVKPDLCAN
jgi:hypothetical protein